MNYACAQGIFIYLIPNTKGITFVAGIKFPVVSFLCSLDAVITRHPLCAHSLPFMLLVGRPLLYIKAPLQPEAQPVRVKNF